ncbi:MAG: tetratricopeptide repeat protein [Bacteroidales bacterium]|nr:tetratricopeptide repeat protein [Bacteroidales bacterium]
MSGAFVLFFALGAHAQDINQAIEFNNNGAEAVKAKNWATALTQFKQALAIAAELGDDGADMVQQIKDLIPSLHYFWGQELAKESKIDEAMEQLNKAIETAELYDDFGTTAADAKKLIDQINMSTATNFLNDKKFDEAIVAFKKILEADPNNGAIYFYIGMAYAGLNNENEAITAYEKAIELGNRDAPPRLANIYLNQAQAAQRSNPPRWTTVYDLAKKALSVAESTNANMLFGLAAVETKRFQEAIPALEKVLSSNPNDATKENMIYRLALAYEGLGKNSEACGYYKQLVNAANKQIADFAGHKIKNVLKCQ